MGKLIAHFLGRRRIVGCLYEYYRSREKFGIHLGPRRKTVDSQIYELSQLGDRGNFYINFAVWLYK